MRLIDFENAKNYTNVEAKKEIDSLKDQLVEDTGRGGGYEDFSDWKLIYHLNQWNGRLLASIQQRWIE